MSNLSIRERILITILGVVLILAVGLSQLILPQMAKLQESRTRLEALQGEKEVMEAQLMQLPTLQGGIVAQREKVTKTAADFFRYASTLQEIQTDDSLQKLFANGYGLRTQSVTLTPITAVALTPYGGGERVVPYRGHDLLTGTPTKDLPAPQLPDGGELLGVRAAYSLTGTQEAFFQMCGDLDQMGKYQYQLESFSLTSAPAGGEVNGQVVFTAYFATWPSEQP